MARSSRKSQFLKFGGKFCIGWFTRSRGNGCQSEWCEVEVYRDSFATSAAIEYVEHINRASDPLHADVIYCSGEQDGVGYELAMQYTTDISEKLLCEQHQYTRGGYACFRIPHCADPIIELVRKKEQRDGRWRGLSPDYFRYPSPSLKAKPKRNWAITKWRALSAPVLGNT